jgi:hypothetical protein
MSWLDVLGARGEQARKRLLRACQPSHTALGRCKAPHEAKLAKGKPEPKRQIKRLWMTVRFPANDSDCGEVQEAHYLVSDGSVCGEACDEGEDFPARRAVSRPHDHKHRVPFRGRSAVALDGLKPAEVSVTRIIFLGRWRAITMRTKSLLDADISFQRWLAGIGHGRT